MVLQGHREILKTAVQFDGAAGRVVVPYTSALNPNGPFTIEFWARRLAGGLQGPVSSMVPARSGGYEFYVGGNFGGYEFHTAASGGYNMITGEGAAPPLGTWTHVAGVCDGVSNITLYVNGYLVSTDNFVAEGTAPFHSKPLESALHRLPAHGHGCVLQWGHQRGGILQL